MILALALHWRDYFDAPSSPAFGIPYHTFSESLLKILIPGRVRSAQVTYIQKRFDCAVATALGINVRPSGLDNGFSSYKA